MYILHDKGYKTIDFKYINWKWQKSSYLKVSDAAFIYNFL